MHLDPNDPRLTAFALGELAELDDLERGELEKHLADCAACRQEVEQLRALAASLAQELRPEPLPAEVRTIQLPTARPPRNLSRYLAAACVLVVGSVGLTLMSIAPLQPSRSSRSSHTALSDTLETYDPETELARSQTSAQTPLGLDDGELRQVTPRVVIQENDSAALSGPQAPATEEPLSVGPSPEMIAKSLRDSVLDPRGKLSGAGGGDYEPPDYQNQNLGGQGGNSISAPVGRPSQAKSPPPLLAKDAEPRRMSATSRLRPRTPPSPVKGGMGGGMDGTGMSGQTPGSSAAPGAVPATTESATVDKPPVAYPEPQVWQRLTQRRKKYENLDAPGGQQRIAAGEYYPPGQNLSSLEAKSAGVDRTARVGSDGKWDGLARPGLKPKPVPPRPQPDREMNTEAYDRVVDNPFLDVKENPLSTFSIDVDTASYSNVRRFLMEANQLPPPDAVRIEELVNYFAYDYAPPKDEAPFAAHIEAADCPWNPEHRLVRIGIKGRVVSNDDRPASNLVFLLDVSGSMQPANKLPLVRQAMNMLVRRLRDNDRVAIVVYAGAAGLVLPSTTGEEKATILSALGQLEAGGSTNGAGGIELAYRVARENFIRGGTNRVILCTDGDFNVGITNRGDLTRLIEKEAKDGTFLTVLGFGMGNYKDATLEQLADKGNGNYGYVDTPAEARKLLVDQLCGTLVTIAKDVKIQIEFNPAQAAGYRLIGYENRLLRKEDFNDDKKDAGEIGAGHTVTALYEIVPAGQSPKTPAVDPLKYQPSPDEPVPERAKPAGKVAGELLTLKLRYKQPDGDKSTLIEQAFTDKAEKWSAASRDFRFAAAVAGFGMVLRHSPYQGSATLGAVYEWAVEGKGPDEQGYRGEFLRLLDRAKSLTKQ